MKKTEYIIPHSKVWAIYAKEEMLADSPAPETHTLPVVDDDEVVDDQQSKSYPFFDGDNTPWE